MDRRHKAEIIDILKAGQDLTLATLREDGWPQATTVSYASDGLNIYFGCDANSQKAKNLGRDDRVSVTVDLPYADWRQIHSLSLSGHARRLTAEADLAAAGKLFLAKFPQIPEYGASMGSGQLAMFRIEPTLVSVLDYSQGFGHTDLVEVDRARDLAA